MDHAFGHFDAAEMHAGELPQEFIVIAGNIYDAGSLAGLAQQLLHHVVATLRPVPAAAQAPAVDDVTDENDRFGLVMSKEVQQIVSLGRLGTKMNIRNEKRSELSGFDLTGHGFHPPVRLRPCGFLPSQNQTRVSAT